ncbi:phosphatase PAP2 family protein [Haloarchaeobius sp. HRN-SO-5]|uniref:phosphatase PAP2 family protein n=1 Tax=Haloarchaeobius sp. HRN-SO-5 TaxID=3446118 RepID=UPI003EC14A1E
MLDPRLFTALQFGAEIREAVPAWLVPLFVFITRLGSVAFFLVVFVLDYWYRNHRRGAHAISLALGGMALIVALKALFAVPRPPDSVNLIPADGYSFPSGHATGSTIAYGLLAYDLDVGSRRARYAGASVLIVLISLSRVVLGVHFVQDVVAGMIIGVTFLAVAISLTGHDPRPGFWLSLGIGVVAAVVSGASHDGVAVLGATLGAVAAWEVLDSVPSVETRHRKTLLAGGLPLLAGLGYVSTRPGLELPLVFVLNVALTAGILLAPALVERVDGLRPSGRVRSDSGAK